MSDYVRQWLTEHAAEPVKIDPFRDQGEPAHPEEMFLLTLVSQGVYCALLEQQDLIDQKVTWEMLFRCMGSAFTIGRQYQEKLKRHRQRAFVLDLAEQVIRDLEKSPHYPFSWLDDE